MTAEEYRLDTVDPRLARVPVLFLIDVSGGKRYEIETIDGNRRRMMDVLNDGLKIFTERVSEDFAAQESVDVSLVTFGGKVKTEQEFRPIKQTWIESSPPTLTGGGSAPMCEAIIQGVNKLEKYEHSLQTELPYKLPLVWLLTDGRPDHSSGELWQEAQKAIGAIGEGFCSHSRLFFAVGLGEKADTEILDNLVSKADDDLVEVLQFEEGLIMDAFRIAADCAKAHSHEGYSTTTEALVSGTVDLKGVNLYKANLCEADLSGRDLSETNLADSDLSKANLASSELRWIDLSGADLSNANLSRANISGPAPGEIADLQRGDTSVPARTRPDLSNADLSNADLSGANLSGANLSGATLTNADLHSMSAVYGHTGSTTLSGATLTEANLKDANLSGANFSDSNLNAANLTGANLTETNLTDANLSEADLSDANLTEACLKRAELSEADLSDADLNAADLSGADLSDADLSDANLTHADLSEADFRGVDLEGTTMDGEEVDLADIEEAGSITERTSSSDR